MAFPSVEVVIPGKRSMPRGMGPLGVCLAEGPWLRVLLALAVTILLSVLPFKAASVSPPLLMSLSAASLDAHAGPVFKDPVKLAHVEFDARHGFLKVAKKTQRKTWGGSPDLGLDSRPRFGFAIQTAPRFTPRRDALSTRASPRPRLRDPPVIG